MGESVGTDRKPAGRIAVKICFSWCFCRQAVREEAWITLLIKDKEDDQMRLLIRDTRKGMNCLFSFASFLPPVTIALHLWQVPQVYQYVHMDTDTHVPAPGGCRIQQLLCTWTGECAVPMGALGSAALAFLAYAKSNDQAEEQMSWRVWDPAFLLIRVTKSWSELEQHPLFFNSNKGAPWAAFSSVSVGGQLLGQLCAEEELGYVGNGGLECLSVTPLGRWYHAT